LFCPPTRMNQILASWVPVEVMCSSQSFPVWRLVGGQRPLFASQCAHLHVGIRRSVCCGHWQGKPVASTSAQTAISRQHCLHSVIRCHSHRLRVTMVSSWGCNKRWTTNRWQLVAWIVRRAWDSGLAPSSCRQILWVVATPTSTGTWG